MAFGPAVPHRQHLRAPVDNSSSCPPGLAPPGGDRRRPRTPACCRRLKPVTRATQGPHLAAPKASPPGPYPGGR